MKNKKTTKLVTKNSRLEARVLQNLKNLFIRAAKIQGVSLTDFIITTVKKEAESVFKSQSLINLTFKDVSLLVETCAKYEEPTSKLKQAATRFKSINVFSN